MKPRGNYQTTAFRNRNKTKSYRVTGTKPDGGRVRENYKTELEALARKQQLEVEAHNFIPEKPPGFGCARLATLAVAAPHPGG